MNDKERIELTLGALERRVCDSKAWLSGDGRVSEQTAGELLGLAVGTLANKRAEGTSPPHYQLGGGHRITYSLYDLAFWIESKRCKY